MAWNIRGYARSSASKLPDQLETIKAALEKDGWKVGNYAVTSDDVPDWRQFWFPFVMRDVFKPGATREQALAAMEKASGSMWTALKDIAADFVADVVIQSAADTADVAKRAAKSVEKASWGIGAGIGFAAFVVGALYLASLLPRGRA